MNEFKSAKPEKLHLRVLKKMRHGILLCLAILLLETREVPEDWKRTNMVPLYKRQKGGLWGIIDWTV